MRRSRADGDPAPRRPAWIPLALYLGITLVVPAFGGAHAEPAFWAHAAQVVAITLAVIAPAAAVGAALRRRSR